MDLEAVDALLGQRPDAGQQVPPLSDAVAIAVYRAVQEALSNVAKHAQASFCHVAMSVDASKQGERLRVTVRDDGRGYDVEAGRSAGVGLIGIRERISAIRGDVTVTSAPGEGDWLGRRWFAASTP